MNAPEPELAILPDNGVRKLTEVEVMKNVNASMFTIEAEDHTLGNILRMDLIEHPKISFVGYRVPHPLKNCIEVRIQTNDPSYYPSQALSDSCDRIIKICKTLEADVVAYEQKRSRDGEEHIY